MTLFFRALSLSLSRHAVARYACTYVHMVYVCVPKPNWVLVWCCGACEGACAARRGGHVSQLNEAGAPQRATLNKEESAAAPLSVITAGRQEEECGVLLAQPIFQEPVVGVLR